MDKVTRQCPQTTIFEEKGEPKRIRTEVPPLTSLAALPLGQTGSLDLIYRSMAIIMTHAVDFERAVTARKSSKVKGMTCVCVCVCVCDTWGARTAQWLKRRTLCKKTAYAR